VREAVRGDKLADAHLSVLNVDSADCNLLVHIGFINFVRNYISVFKTLFQSPIPKRDFRNQQKWYK
jgi:hypothetical protein